MEGQGEYFLNTRIGVDIYNRTAIEILSDNKRAKTHTHSPGMMARLSVLSTRDLIPQSLHQSHKTTCEYTSHR